ncbi:uncharacterized protein LOC124532179 [Vanessa cardui]|uniref:uncharacterized protein LOC124532179 n=1 Tax=Vanessa cardui TaxID=171605 RepID=UPI001F141827|nr:uncharacterized protein LOC124532179 [Vanessa cardui]
MNAPSVLCFIYFLTFATLSSTEESNVKNSSDVKQFEIYDGVYVKIPEKNDANNKIMSLEINENKNEETGRGKQKKLMQRLLPLFIMPFVLQSTIVPLFLGVLKFMLFKSLMIGKLALVLIIINAFKNSNSFKGRQDEDIAKIHYGYHGHGMDEYGSYFNS